MNNQVPATIIMLAFPITCFGSNLVCEKETETLLSGNPSWSDVFITFNNLPTQCFDGYFAEGISQLIGGKLNNEWHSFLTEIPPYKENKKIISFILKSINATLQDNDLSAIKNSAEHSCSKDNEKICLEILELASDAIEER